MAFGNIKTSAEHLTITAGANLTGHQYKGVHITGAGALAATGATNSGFVYVCYNTPASGEAVKLYGAPNTVEAVAGGTIAIGNYIQCLSGGAFVATSHTAWVNSGGPLCVGVAHSAVASGGRFALRLT